ncbi:MAG: NAD(P)H-quinone oxidoreductase subunit L [Okeania sp. SIO2H7]|nr:NAD(P)H-quinone oxidoreductase subunit L [Okeania sp. SIO2H7]
MDIISTLLEFGQAHVAALLLYIGLGGAYLVVGPLVLMAYLNKRWYSASSVERLLMYFGVFFFFPGLLLFSPFINYRPQQPS